MKRPIVIFILLGLICAFYFFSSEDDGRSAPLKSDLLLSGSGETPARVIKQSAFYREYGSEGGSIEKDLEALLSLVTDCQLIVKNFDSFYLPDNKAITDFLRGHNPDRIAWIPPGHSSISGDGELLDRNGVPIFFHRESGMRIQVRSAGEDRQMWTSDDIVQPNRQTAPEAN